MDEQSERQDAEEPPGEPRFLAGHFLISDINLMDPNFFRSVVLMISHDEEGAFGLVVNRPSRYTLGDLVDGARDTPVGLHPRLRRRTGPAGNTFHAARGLPR